MRKCIECGTTLELMPVGPDNSDICFDCGLSPEYFFNTQEIVLQKMGYNSKQIPELIKLFTDDGTFNSMLKEFGKPPLPTIN